LPTRHDRRWKRPAGAGAASRIFGQRLGAPNLLGFEMASILTTRLRRQPATRDGLLAAYAGFEEMVIETMPVPFRAVALLADSARLTAYDAADLWLARNLRVPLVTLDARLAQAAALP